LFIHVIDYVEESSQHKSTNVDHHTSPTSHIYDVSHLSYQPSSKNSESSPKFPKVPQSPIGFFTDLLLSSKEPSAVQIKAIVPTHIVQAPAALADTTMLEEDVETHPKKKVA